MERKYSTRFTGRKMTGKKPAPSTHIKVESPLPFSMEEEERVK